MPGTTTENENEQKNMEGVPVEEAVGDSHKSSYLGNISLRSGEEKKEEEMKEDKVVWGLNEKEEEKGKWGKLDKRNEGKEEGKELPQSEGNSKVEVKINEEMKEETGKPTGQIKRRLSARDRVRSFCKLENLKLDIIDKLLPNFHIPGLGRSRSHRRRLSTSPRISNSIPSTPTTPTFGILANPDTEKAAFYMYLEQLQNQVIKLNQSMIQLEAHLDAVSAGLRVLETVSRTEIRRRLRTGVIGEGVGEDAVVREWLRELDDSVKETKDDDDEYGDGGKWRERVTWERKVFRESVGRGVDFMFERIDRVKGGVKAAEVKKGRLVERGVMGGEEGSGKVQAGGVGEFEGKAPQVIFEECGEEVQRLVQWIELLKRKFLDEGEEGTDGGFVERSAWEW